MLDSVFFLRLPLLAYFLALGAFTLIFLLTLI